MKSSIAIMTLHLPGQKCLGVVHFIVLVVALIAASSTPCRAGYAHYWTWLKQPDPAALKACAADMKQLINARESITKLTPPDPSGKGRDLVDVNGVGDDEYEPFVFPGDIGDDTKSRSAPADDKGFNFCKTEAHPYDEVVTACLIAARDHFSPDVLQIESDGAWDDGSWLPGAILYHTVLGRTAHNPMLAIGTKAGTLQTDSRSMISTIVIVGLAVAVLVFIMRKRA